MAKKGSKILFISQYAGIIGGTEKFIFSASNLLRKNGYKTTAIYFEKTANAEKYLSAFDETFSTGEIGKLSAEDFALCTLHKIQNPEILSALVEKFSPVCFAHDHDYFCPKGYKYYPYKRINCLRPYNRIVCGACASIVPPRHITQGVGNFLRKNFCEIARLNRAVKKCPSFAVLSNFMRDELAANGIAKEKVKLISPFLDFSDAHEKTEAPAKPFKMVFAGQHVMSKGLHLLFDALTKTKCETFTHVLGTGPRTDYFKGLCAQLGLDGKVRFEGFTNSPDRFYAEAHATVFPSMWQEPFGLVGIESMKHATPVIGFDVGGVSEWLKDGLNGVIVKERDTAAFARAIDTLAADPALLKKLGEGGRNFVKEHYTEERFLSVFLNLK